MNRKEQLREQISPLFAELNKLECVEKTNELKGLVGRYFRYRNSRGFPESEADKWWIYRHVTGVIDGDISAVSFQVDKNGKIEIYRSNIFNDVTDWQEIDKEEYMAAWKNLVAGICDIDP